MVKSFHENKNSFILEILNISYHMFLFSIGD